MTSSDAPLVSVIVCTRNRAVRLRRCLESIMASTAAADFSSELIVVDNGSTDGTADVVRLLGNTGVDVRYIQEPVQGLSRARNAGVECARSEIVLFADDDVVVPVCWVTGMTEPLRSGRADAVGGRVVLADDLRRSWMTPTLRMYFAETVYPNAEAPAIVGPSMAFLRRWAVQHPFDETLGAGRLGDGETELFHYQIRQAGARIVPCHDLSVIHHFDPDRLARSAQLAHAWRDGASSAYIAHHWLHTELRWLLARQLKHRLQLLTVRLSCRSRGEGVTERERSLVFEIAFHKQLRREHKTPRKYAKQDAHRLSSFREMA